jgi:hypothetical protein
MRETPQMGVFHQHALMQDEGPVILVRLHELLVSARGEALVFIQEQHTIAILQRREFVGYDKEGFVLYEGRERTKDRSLCLAVKGGGGLIKN